MEQDNVLPNDGSYFLPREPVEQEIGRKKERAKTLEAGTTLKVVINHLEEKIAFFGSVDAMPSTVKTDPEKFLMIHNANELTRDNLRTVKEFIESLLDSAGVGD